MAGATQNPDSGGRFQHGVLKEVLANAPYELGELHFEYSEFSESHSTGWNEETVPGRSEPFQLYSSGGAVSFTITASVVALDSSFDMRKTLNLLKSWTFPISGSILSPPPALYLILNKYVTERVVLDSYNILNKAPYDRNGIPIVAEFDLELKRVGRAQSYGDVRGK